MLEVKFTSHGILALAGIVCLVLGMLTWSPARCRRCASMSRLVEDVRSPIHCLARRFDRENKSRLIFR
jgi:membrane-bound ClpP family serine protease